MAKIHPLAIVNPGAKLGDNVEVGPYAYIDDNVEIGDGTKVLPHATIFPYVRIGRDCTIFPGAVIGAIPQDLKFDGEVTYVEIGGGQGSALGSRAHGRRRGYGHPRRRSCG